MSNKANVALLSIHPRFSDAILSGGKRVEFRRKPFGRDIKFVVIYASSPIMKVVGYFQVRRITVVNLKEAWEKYGRTGNISKSEFSSYYQGMKHVVAIEISQTKKLAQPLPLKEINRNYRAPQSYRYIASKEFEQIQKSQQSAKLATANQ